jgi:hypothetical protein
VYELLVKTREVEITGSHLSGVGAAVHTAINFYKLVFEFVLNSLILLSADEACPQQSESSESNFGLLRCRSKILWADIESIVIEKFLDQGKSLVKCCIYLSGDTSMEDNNLNYFYNQDSILFSIFDMVSNVKGELDRFPCEDSIIIEDGKNEKLSNVFSRACEEEQICRDVNAANDQNRTKTRLSSGLVKAKRPVHDLGNIGSRKRKMTRDIVANNDNDAVVDAEVDEPMVSAKESVVIGSVASATEHNIPVNPFSSCCVNEDFLSYTGSLLGRMRRSDSTGNVSCEHLSPLVLQVVARVLETMRRLLAVYHKRLSTIHLWQLKARALISFIKACEVIVNADTKQSQKMIAKLQVSGGDILQLLKDAESQFIVSSER